MTVYNGETAYPCTKAVKTDNSIFLYDGDQCIVSFVGISNFGAYTIDGGEWSEPEPMQDEVLRADVDYLLMITEEL